MIILGVQSNQGNFSEATERVNIWYLLPAGLPW